MYSLYFKFFYLGYNIVRVFTKINQFLNEIKKCKIQYYDKNVQINLRKSFFHQYIRLI